MSAIGAIRRPILAPHARYRWDAIRKQHQVVFPESALELNETGAAIVKLCDGREMEALISALESECGRCGLAPDVIEFLQSLADRGLLRDADRS
ncbi:pyrroloquinoline quinone biosynthesis peptide chaperone PqqD [Candidatus Sumerlaeota bacterium]|nr:pyrroloquinoline quinone biosynthesis peptide chaperone PqqD [Candidatus Sumerlaeota bacterium]